MKKITLVSLLLTVAFTAFGASNCSYSEAQSRNLTRTISLVNQMGSNAQFAFGSKTPSNDNPTMAWQDDPNNTNANNGQVNLGICCNDQTASQPIQLTYNVTQNGQTSACTMNLNVKCTPTLEMVQESQSCQNSSIKVSAQYVNTVDTQYTFSNSGSTSMKKAQ
jgi:hypothetical protein